MKGSQAAKPRIEAAILDKPDLGQKTVSRKEGTTRSRSRAKVGSGSALGIHQGVESPANGRLSESCRLVPDSWYGHASHAWNITAGIIHEHFIQRWPYHPS